MQTIEFIETVKWLIATIPESTVSFILETGWQEIMHRTADKGDMSGYSFKASHSLASLTAKVAAHPYAMKVLKAYDLDVLFAEDFPIDLAKAFSSGRAEPIMELGSSRLYDLGRNWRVLTGTIEPLEKLTIPTLVTNERDFDEILTIEIKISDEQKPSILHIEQLLSSASKLYSAVSFATTKGDIEPLKVVYLTSGSGYRFDLKGLGEPIKRLKELFIESWEKIRHRKADDLHHNVKAVLKGLDVLEKIGAHKHLDSETKIRLTHDITESMFELFEAGALPREIKSVETISNVALIEGFQTKLLPAPQVEKSSKPRAKRVTKKATPKRKL